MQDAGEEMSRRTAWVGEFEQALVRFRDTINVIVVSLHDIRRDSTGEDRVLNHSAEP